MPAGKAKDDPNEQRMSNRLGDSIFNSSSQSGSSVDGEYDPESDAHRQPTRSPGRGSIPRPARGGGRTPGQPRRWLLTALVTLLVVAGGGYFATHQLRPVFESVFGAKDYNGSGSGSVRFVVQPGDTGRAIADNLVDSGVIRAAGPFEAALTDQRGKEIQPGTYSLRAQMSAASALSMLRDIGSRQVLKVTVPEGRRATEVFALLADKTGRPLADYRAVAANPDTIGLPAQAGGKVEGYLFPATYSFDPDDDALDQLATMVGRMRTELDQLSVPVAERRRVVILASLIEMEARNAADRPKVARVLENRLAAKMPLQLDSTVKYSYPSNGKVTTTDAQRNTKNDYNTYAMSGLPAGPIDNPGRASLKAALAPTPGPWLYFVTVDPLSGLTRFATTYAEHNVNVAAFQAWCQANAGHC